MGDVEDDVGGRGCGGSGGVVGLRAYLFMFLGLGFLGLCT